MSTPPLVTISMPTFGTPPDLLRRAVDAVLAQTWVDFELVVTFDGTTDTRALVDYRDPRLCIWVRNTSNRGRYWSDAVVFAASSSPYFAVHDADDAARPEWLASLLANIVRAGRGLLDPPVASFGAQCVHAIGGSERIEGVRPFSPHAGLQHLAHMAGVFDRRWLASVGGPHPGFRVGFDTLLTALPYLTGHRVAVLDEVLYDRYKRLDSLTTSKATGMRSPYRQGVARALARLWSTCERLGDEHLISQVLCAYPDAAAGARDRAAVAEEAELMRTALEAREDRRIPA